MYVCTICIKQKKRPGNAQNGTKHDTPKDKHKSITNRLPSQKWFPVNTQGTTQAPQPSQGVLHGEERICNTQEPAP